MLRGLGVITDSKEDNISKLRTAVRRKDISQIHKYASKVKMFASGNGNQSIADFCEFLDKMAGMPNVFSQLQGEQLEYLVRSVGALVKGEDFEFHGGKIIKGIAESWIKKTKDNIMNGTLDESALRDVLSGKNPTAYWWNDSFFDHYNQPIIDHSRYDMFDFGMGRIKILTLPTQEKLWYLLSEDLKYNTELLRSLVKKYPSLPEIAMQYIDDKVSAVSPRALERHGKQYRKMFGDLKNVAEIAFVNDQQDPNVSDEKRFKSSLENRIDKIFSNYDRGDFGKVAVWLGILDQSGNHEMDSFNFDSIFGRRSMFSGFGSDSYLTSELSGEYSRRIFDAFSVKELLSEQEGRRIRTMCNDLKMISNDLSRAQNITEDAAMAFAKKFQIYQELDDEAGRLLHN